MKNQRARKWCGAIVAAITLSLVTSVAPASAGEKGTSGKSKQDRVLTLRDSGWD